MLGHLVDVAVMLADTALLRSLQSALEARAADMQSVNWLAAGYLGDRGLPPLAWTSSFIDDLRDNVCGVQPE